MDQRVHQVRLVQWSQWIINRKKSGLTVAQWCESNGFTKDAYYYWQKRVREAALDTVSTNVATGLTVNDGALTLQDGASPAFAELPQPSGLKPTAHAGSFERSAFTDCRSAAVTIRHGSTVIAINNDANSRILSFVREVIRNAE